MIPRVSELKKLLISRDIGEHDAWEIFIVKRSTISDISKELLNDVCTEFDRAVQLKELPNYNQKLFMCPPQK